MAHNLSHFHLGTTAPSPSGAVAPAARTRAVTFGRTEAATELGKVSVAADDVEDYGTCNCSRYETCQYCTCSCGVQLDRDGVCAACETDRVCSEYDDAFMDSFYRQLGGLGGQE